MTPSTRKKIRVCIEAILRGEGMCGYIAKEILAILDEDEKVKTGCCCTDENKCAGMCEERKEPLVTATQPTNAGDDFDGNE